MGNKEQKENFLFKKLDLAFVYLFIFLVGIAIVLGMTSFLNSKVQEFNNNLMTVETIN